MPKIVYFVKISLEVVEESNIKHMGNVGSLGTWNFNVIIPNFFLEIRTFHQGICQIACKIFK